MVFVQVSLYIKDGDKWSEPIPAFGGDFLIKKDRNGTHGNDEGFKMAITDALGTACKMIGVAADIYRGLIAKGASDSKYARREYQQSQPPVNNGQDEMKRKSLLALNEKAKSLGILPEEVKAIIGVKYNKLSSKELTAGEAADLANNIQKYIEEAMGQPIGVGA
jgi:hypothetical protein